MLQAGEVHEVAGPVHLMVELLGIGKDQFVGHFGVVPHLHQVVVPGTLPQSEV